MPICPKCGNQAADNALFCDQCGTRLPAAQPEPAPETFVETPAGSVPEGVVICPDCGAENVPGEVFCDVCGSPLAPPEPVAQAAAPEPVEAETVIEEVQAEPIVEEIVLEEPLIQEVEVEEVIPETIVASPPQQASYCPTCGAAIQAGDTFCANCGAALGEAIAQEEVAPIEPIIQEIEEPIVPETVTEEEPIVEEIVVEEEPIIEEIVVEEEPLAQEIIEPELAEEELHCQVCGAGVQPGQAFCASCGAALQVEEAEPEPAPVQAPVAPAPAAAAGPYLEVVDTRAQIPLVEQPELLIGRTDQVSGVYPDIDLTPHGGDEGGVSRRHAKLIHEGNAWFIMDLDSTNGTYVNGTELTPKTRAPLNSGDQLSLGEIEVVFYAP
jgi:predicted amidophosphoribosyltransferase